MREKADGGRSAGFSYGLGRLRAGAGKPACAGGYSFCFRYRLGLMP